jgi:hypothetical protein
VTYAGDTYTTDPNGTLMNGAVGAMGLLVGLLTADGLSTVRPHRLPTIDLYPYLD